MILYNNWEAVDLRKRCDYLENASSRLVQKTHGNRDNNMGPITKYISNFVRRYQS